MPPPPTFPDFSLARPSSHCPPTRPSSRRLPAPSTPPTPPNASQSKSSEQKSTESPPRRDLRDLLSHPPVPTHRLPLPSASIFTTSTAHFLQSRPIPSPSSSPAPSPTSSPLALPTLPRPLTTPPRATPASVKKGLAASFATILATPPYQPPSSPFTYTPCISTSTTVITPRIDSRSTTPSDESPQSARSQGGSEGGSPHQMRVGPLFQGAGYTHPLSLLMLGMSEVLSESPSVLATLSSLLRLVLDFSRADDVKLISRCGRGEGWGVDGHVRSPTASPLPQSAASVSRYPTAMSVRDPHSILYDFTPQPDFPHSVLQLVLSTSSILQLSPSSIRGDPALASDPYFAVPPPGSSAVAVKSLMALPVLVGGRFMGALVLASEVREDGFMGVDVAALQVVSSTCALLVERRGEERRRLEWERMVEECTQMKAEVRQSRLLMQQRVG